jgi:hypothetical protein
MSIGQHHPRQFFHVSHCVLPRGRRAYAFSMSSMRFPVCLIIARGLQPTNE